MAPGLLYYPYPMPSGPTADHIHERYLQHRGLWRALSLRKPNQELVPNHPDADIIDYLNHYIVEVEVPGIKDVSKLQVTWLDANTLVVRGKTDAHEGIVEPWETEKLNGEDGQKEHHHRPYEVVQERRLGSFERHFWFPHATVKADEMTARLEAGLLTMKVPKEHLHLAKNKGEIKIASGD